MSNTENIAVEGTIPTAVQNTQPNCPEPLTMTMQEQRTRRLTRTATGLLLFWALVLQHVYADASEKKPMLTTGHANQVGVNKQRLELAADLVEESIDGGKIPNAVILVAKDGKIILHEAFGHRDIQRKAPMRTDSLFRMASNSKALTAAGIMLLVERGKVDLDQPVGAYLKVFDNEKWKKITLRHLLTHTSGIRIKPLFLTPLIQNSASHPTAPDLILEVERFAAISGQHQAGATYSYNNAGYNILAGVIEKVTGSYKTHLKQHIYNPLGMSDSCNHEPDADHSRMSTISRLQKDGSWTAGWQPGDAPDWPFPRGSGGMVTSARDFAVFCQMLLNGGRYGNQQIIQSESISEMTNPQNENCPAAVHYGLGWKVHEPGGTFEHSGSDGTYVWVNPKMNLIGMLLTQSNGTKPPRTEFRKLVESACIQPDLPRK